MFIATLTDLDARRCTAFPNNLDEPASRRTPAHTDCITNLLSSKDLWTEYGVDDDIIVSSIYLSARWHMANSPDDLIAFYIGLPAC
jgi:hypothetical protein